MLTTNPKQNNPEAQTEYNASPQKGAVTQFVSGFWEFMRAAFVFFGKVLEVVKHDTRLTILWGFGVLFLVILISILVLADDLPATPKVIVIVLVLLILSGLFVYTLPRVRFRQPAPEPLIALLRDRAEVVQTTIDNKIQALQNASHGGTGPRSNHAKVEILANAKIQFVNQHEKHINCLREADFTRAHEICRTIQQVLHGLVQEFQFRPQPGMLYNIMGAMFSGQFGSYPGTRPTDISDEIQDKVLNAIWHPKE